MVVGAAKEINDLMRKIIVAKLITGYNTITGKGGQTMAEANVFAVFNSDTYKVKFYNMKEVLTKVFSSGRYKGGMQIPVYFYQNNIWQPQVADRISNLLRVLNAKVSYTLKESEYNKS